MADKSPQYHVEVMSELPMELMNPDGTMATLVEVPIESVQPGETIIIHEHINVSEAETDEAIAMAEELVRQMEEMNEVKRIEAKDKPVVLVMGNISTEQLLNTFRLLVHYKFMVSFLNRNILVGSTRTLLNAAVPKFKSDLKAVDSQFKALLQSVPVLEELSNDMKQYHIDLNKQYVTNDGKLINVDWDTACRKRANIENAVKNMDKVKTKAVSPAAGPSLTNRGCGTRTDEDLTDHEAEEDSSHLPKKKDELVKRRKPLGRRNRGTNTHPIPRPKLEIKPSNDELIVNPVPDFRCSYHGCRFRSNLSIEEVKGHEIRFHENANMFHCPRLGCITMFPSIQELTEHLDEYHTPVKESSEEADSVKFLCPIDFCKQLFPSVNDLRSHLRDLHTIQFESCSRCKKRFTNRHSLLAHVRAIHKTLSQEERNQILLLPEQAKDEVKKGRRSRTNKPGSFERCMLENCNIVFPNSIQLLKHIKEFHPQLYTTCKYCGKVCQTRQMLNIHHYHYHREGEYACRERGCTFKSNICVNLKRHEKREHQKPIACSVEDCNELLLAQYMPAHNREHHPELFETVMPCTWPNCKKKFNDQVRLRRHIRSHSALKRYRCKYLDCTFASELKGTVVAHVRVCHLNLPRTERDEAKANMQVHSYKDICQYVDILNIE